MRQTLLFLFLFIFVRLSAQISFKQEYEFVAPDVPAHAPSFVQMPDSGFMIVNSRQLIFSDSVFIITRLDKWGSVMWMKEIPFRPHQDWWPNIVKFNDYEYAILAGDLVMKIDTGANIIWCKETTPAFMNFNVTKDEGLILQGVQLFPNNDGIVTLAKLDSMGNVQWSTAIDTFTAFPVGITAVPLASGGEVYISVSETNSQVTSEYAAITGISDAGAFLWTWHTRWNYRPDVLVTPDSSVWLTGEGFVDTNGFVYGMVITEVDPISGQVLSLRSLNPFPGGFMNATIQGDTIIASGLQTANGPWQRWYVCFDTSLAVHYAYYSWAPASSFGFWPWSQIQFTSDGGFAMTTLLQKNGPPPGASVYLVKAAPGGSTCDDTAFSLVSGQSVWIADAHYNQQPFSATTIPASITSGPTLITIINHCRVGIPESESNAGGNFYPNPTSGLFTIEIPGSTKPEHISVINCLGETVMQKSNYRSGETLDCSSLASGCYYILVNGLAIQQPIVLVNE